MIYQKSIGNPEELYRKLERTFYRRPTYGENQVDWVFDFAITAWHLVDWTNEVNKMKLQDTQNQLKTKCPELAVCEQICNGAKHLSLNNPQLTPFDITTNVQGTNDLMGTSTDIVPNGKPVDVILTSAVLIYDKGGNSWQAIDLFRNILQFWKSELSLTLKYSLH